MAETVKETVIPDPARKIDIEIGDSKQVDFYPQLKVLQWDNEVNFSARLVAADYTGAVVSTAGDKIEWAKDNQIARFYSTPPDEKNEDGGFEIEVEFASRPDSNVVTYTIQTKELEFFYQPALTSEEIKRGDVRPDNVIGSYAAYHASKRDNAEGGKAYRNGKAFHVYRPSAKDANGQEVWCDLHIDTDAGLLTITVPQDFLDSATYPVIVDPTLGYASIGATSGGFANAQIEFHGPYTPGSSGTVTDIQIYGNAVSARVTFGIYSDSAGAPSSLLATSAELILTNTPSWQQQTISLAITSGTPYWLAYRANASGAIYYDTATPSGKFNTSSTYVAGVMPGTPPALTNFTNIKRSDYVNYTVSGIAFDAAANSGDVAAASSYSGSASWSGADRMLSVDVPMLGPGVSVSAMTYGGAACTFIGSKATVTSLGGVECWRICSSDLGAPAAGANTLSVTLTGSIEFSVAWASYTGVNQSFPVEGFNSAQATNVGSATDASVSITSVADNCWIHGAVVANDTSITANQTTRNNISGTLGSGANEDNNTAKTPAGAVTMSYSGMGITTTWAIAGYAIRPLAATGIPPPGESLIYSAPPLPPLPFSGAVNNLLLTTLLVTSAPFSNSLLSPIAFPSRTLGDTSRGMAKVLYSDATPPNVNAQLGLLPFFRTYPDTSQSAFALRNPPVVVSSPFASYDFGSVVRPLRIAAETSQGIPKTLLTEVNLPFRSYFLPPERLHHIFSETSFGIAKTLYPDATRPIFNYQHFAPDAVRRTPQDTTQQSSVVRGIPSPAATVTISVMNPYITVYFWKRTA